MVGMRKLRSRSRSTQYAVKPLRQKQHFPLGKMSEVIIDFAEPLPNTIDDELFEEALRFAAICWNISSLPENERKQIAQSLVNDIGKSDILKRLRVEDDIRKLLEHKKAFFADDIRKLIDFKVVEEKGSRRLLAMSAFTKDRVEENQRDAHDS